MSAENFVHQLQQRFPQAQHLSEHTAECFPNMIFVCVGLDVDVVVQRMKQVSAQGAIGAVVDDSLVNVLGSYDLPLPYLSVQDLATQRAAIAHHFYNQPSSTLQCVGVTGTNGKTSIAYYIAQLTRLVDGCGGYIGTIGSGEVGQLATSAMTTPNPIAIQRLLADAAAET